MNLPGLLDCLFIIGQEIKELSFDFSSFFGSNVFGLRFIFSSAMGVKFNLANPLWHFV